MGNNLVVDSTLPVEDATDVQAEWSQDVYNVQAPQPVIAALQAGQAAMLIAYQNAADYAAAQSDPAHATDEYLDECLSERGLRRNPGESNESARSRLFSAVTVSPEQIIAVANAVLAPYTAVSCVYFENSDSWFVGDGTTTWASYVFGSDKSQTPDYLDRDYADLPHRHPLGARVFDSPYGRIFVLLAPEISGIDANVSAVFDWPTLTDLVNAPADDGFFVSDGTIDVASYVWSIAATAEAVYASLANAVNAIVGQSIRWILWVEPKLTN